MSRLANIDQSKRASLRPQLLALLYCL